MIIEEVEKIIEKIKKDIAESNDKTSTDQDFTESLDWISMLLENYDSKDGNLTFIDASLRKRIKTATLLIVAEGIHDFLKEFCNKDALQDLRGVIDSVIDLALVLMDESLSSNVIWQAEGEKV